MATAGVTAYGGANIGAATLNPYGIAIGAGVGFGAGYLVGDWMYTTIVDFLASSGQWQSFKRCMDNCGAEECLTKEIFNQEWSF